LSFIRTGSVNWADNLGEKKRKEKKRKILDFEIIFHKNNVFRLKIIVS
jgi:hypothetical protein